jgi:hypothetical protein
LRLWEAAQAPAEANASLLNEAFAPDQTPVATIRATIFTDEPDLASSFRGPDALNEWMSLARDDQVAQEPAILTAGPIDWACEEPWPVVGSGYDVPRRYYEPRLKVYPHDFVPVCPEAQQHLQILTLPLVITGGCIGGVALLCFACIAVATRRYRRAKWGRRLADQVALTLEMRQQSAQRLAPRELLCVACSPRRSPLAKASYEIVDVAEACQWGSDLVRTLRLSAQQHSPLTARSPIRTL